MSKLEKLLELPRRVDRRLKKVIGEGNELLYHFVRLLLIAVIFAVVVAVVVEIVLALYRAISIVIGALIVAWPYLLALAIVAGIAALIVFVRRRRAKRRQKVEPPGEATSAVAPQKHSPAVTAARPSDEDTIRRSMLAADQPTRAALQTVLTSLQRFDHRLELVITQVHYTDLFGDNWAVVRQFVESPQGRGVPEVSSALLEIVILYKRAQEARWVPINHDRIHAWWTEAARRRKGLSEVFDSTAAQTGPGEAADRPASGAASPDESPKPDAATPGVPPTLDDLLEYYERMKRVG
jgi:hypothetical protein